MAVTELNSKNTATIILNTGVDSSGSITTGKVSLGTLSDNPDAWDAQKAMNIIDSLSDLFDYTIYDRQRVGTFKLVNG